MAGKVNADVDVKKEMDDEEKEDDQWQTLEAVIPPKNPRNKPIYKYNPFARIYFCWLDQFIWYGFKHILQHSDLYAHPSEADSRYLLDKFSRYWDVELKKRENGGTPKMWLAIAKCLWWKILLHGILCATLVGFLVGQSVLLGFLSDYFAINSPTSVETRNAYLIALGMALISLTTVTVTGRMGYLGFILGMLIRIIVTGALYKKILKLSQNTVGKLTIGHIVNLASNDVHRFDMSMIFYHFFWIGPIHLAIVTYFIYNEIGPTAFIATLLVIAQIPLQIILARLFTKLRLKAASQTDTRVKIMNEVISGIRVIKMYGWEYAFERLVANIRKKEVNIILKSSVIRAINLSYYVIALPTIMFVVFSVYASMEGINSLSPKKVFTTFSLLTYVRLTSINFLVKGTIQVAEAKVALQRIKAFLLMDELKLKQICNEEEKRNCTEEGDSGIESNHKCSSSIPLTEIIGDHMTEGNTNSFICAEKLCASWSGDSDKLTLNNISFTVNKDNPLLAVVGAVGSGKSTLLQCILDELPPLSGEINMKGEIAYASQEPWIYSATLRENILFGLPYDFNWYNTVVEACALDKDIELLPHGDLTTVGERGITLSGGQKARVSLARAIYCKADIYLLDDPLSAVDAAVSRHLFDRCIRGMLSQTSCVVLVTHQLQYVQQCDTVLGLNEGCVTVIGDPSEILKSGFDFIGLLGENEDNKGKDPRKQYLVRKDSLVSTNRGSLGQLQVSSALKNITEEEEEEEEGKEEIDETNIDYLTEDDTLADAESVYSVPPLTAHFKKQISNEFDGPSNMREGARKKVSQNALGIPAEDRVRGVVSYKTYYQYFKSGGGHLYSSFVLLMFLIGEVSIVVTDWWLSDWADCSAETNSSRSTCNVNLDQRIGIFGGLLGSVWIFSIARSVLFYVLMLRAARILHNKMFMSVLRSPVLFFDTNPVGRVLNRFSKDTGFLDDILIFSFCEFIQLMSRFFAIMITAVIANPYLLIVVVIIMLVFFLFRWYFLKSAREVKRIEALARSPLYSHISMTLQGLSTIRAYRRQSDNLELFHEYQNYHTQAWYTYIVSSRWFSMRVDSISSIFVISVAFISIPLAGSLNAGLVGLALTYAISLNGMFQYCIRQSAEVESHMVSAERVIAYGKLEPENSLETQPISNKPHSDWPDKGVIELNDLSYRYSPETPFVLHGVSCLIKSGEKIGIVGRTGAGKSSLIASFFRLAEPRGSIKIDGIECFDIGLHDLRPNISIIPQDPVLFTGSVRYNLDPFDKFDDEKIWKALKQVQLKGVVESLEGGLDSFVSEGGSNFSVGQKQLFCLARALLKNNKVLMLDEATANVDLETDAIIQEVIREQFAHCTVLTIAHRLDTVMDSDKIMVLRAGELCEFGEAHELLDNPNSYLLRLVEHTGPVAATKLKNMALSAYNSRRTSTI